MTANREESPYGGRTGLSVWAENNRLAGEIVQLRARVDRLLAEQETDSEKVKRLKRKIAKLQAERGEPDYLIDRHGDAWRRTGEDSYALFNGSEEFDGRTREHVEAEWGPVAEAWKGRK